MLSARQQELVLKPLPYALSQQILVADAEILSSPVKNKRLSCFYFFEEAVRDYPDAEAIWSREGIYTWKETHTKACQYATYFLELGIRPGELVAFCLQNSPEFICAWLGLWAIVGFEGFWEWKDLTD